ncbi:hypothetical protein [Succinivibrio dextrinosolvens]|uniref:hypothetical protein n=1 Tax=Succinivibrio dextrinosolvens TaxID=83771 RepID=UPI0013E92435|nr:hypothetical protein [Succinivibrio dextrinosolvens]
MTALDNRKITDDSVPWDSSCYENFNPQYDENYSDYDCYPNDEDELEKLCLPLMTQKNESNF